MAYDGIMMSRVINEMKTEIERGRINKIYQISQYELLLHMRANGKNTKLLLW